MTQRLHTTFTSRLMASVVLSVAALVTGSCSSSPASPSSNGSPAPPIGSSGMLKLMLTDAPTDEVEEVNMYFTSVTVKPVGGPVEELDIDLAVNPVDLLTLEGSVTDFASGLVPAGEYEFVRINIDEGLSHLVVNGMEKSLKIPSEEIKILGRFTVGGESTTVMTLDFDARASLLRLGNGGWLLKPAIVIMGNGGNGPGEDEEEEDEDEDEEAEDDA